MTHDAISPDFITLSDGEGNLILRIKPDGNIELGKSVSLDEVSKQFWDVIQSYAKSDAKAMKYFQGKQP